MNAVFKYLLPVRHMAAISAALLGVGRADASEKEALTYGAQIGIVITQIDIYTQLLLTAKLEGTRTNISLVLLICAV